MLIIFVAHRLEFVSSSHAPILGAISLGLIPANVLACRSLQRQNIGTQQRQVETLGWLLLDLFQFFLLLSLSQGIQNPFYPLLYVYTLLGAILLPRQLSWGYLLALATGIYLLNPVVYVFNATQTYVRLSSLTAWGIQFGTLLALWLLASSLSRRLLAWRHRAEALRQRQASLQKVHLMGALGAGVAHEFATPMNTLRLRLKRLERLWEKTLPKGGPPSDLRAALKALEQCELRLKHMAALPAKADLARLEALEIEPYLNQVLQTWQPQWPEVQIILHNHLPAGSAFKLPELVLRQSLLNLLNNAAQAMQAKGTIAISLQQRSQELQIEICDQGPGWPSMVLEHLGEPFITTRPEGTGLGLYNVHLLAQALDGHFQIYNQEQGACARLCLPILKT